MEELTAGDIMEPNVFTINQNATVQELAELLSRKEISGVPVMDDNQRLVGIVSEGDMISMDADLHFPHYIQFLDSVIFLESMKKFDLRFRHAAATRVKEIMTADVRTVPKSASLHDVATLMTDHQINRVPVLEGDALVGIVTRADLIKAVSGKR